LVIVNVSTREFPVVLVAVGATVRSEVVQGEAAPGTVTGGTFGAAAGLVKLGAPVTVVRVVTLSGGTCPVTVVGAEPAVVEVVLLAATVPVALGLPRDPLQPTLASTAIRTVRQAIPLLARRETAPPAHVARLSVGLRPWPGSNHVVPVEPTRIDSTRIDRHRRTSTAIRRCSA
jgi:hypothetical protein